MITLIKNILIISTVFLTLSSCATICSDYCSKQVTEHKYNTSNSYVECPVPDKPVFRSMSSTYHIGGKRNLDVISYDLVLIMMYNQQLINTIDCYKKQTVGSEVIK